jgi:hypothetical protein
MPGPIIRNALFDVVRACAVWLVMPVAEQHGGDRFDLMAAGQRGTPFYGPVCWPRRSFEPPAGVLWLDSFDPSS